VSNLSDLLPAGAAAKQLTFTDSGSGIATKKPVVLESDGDVTEVTGTTTAAAVQTEVEFLSSAVDQTNLVWDSTNSKAVVFYKRAGVGFCKVGSLSGSTLTWGTETSIIGYPTDQNAVCFDSTANKIIFMYEDGSGTYYTKAIVGEISGSSISFPGISYNVWANTNNSSYAVTYDSTNDRIVFAARVWSNYYGEAKVASLSGTALTFGTAVTFESASTDMIGMGFDSTAGKVLIAYRDGGNSSYGTAIVGTVGSGTTTISFGTAAVFNSADSQLNQVAHDPTANKNLIAYYDSTTTYSYGVVATISGTSVSFGTPVISSNSVAVSTSWDRAPVVYNAAIKKPVFLYQEGASPYNLKYSIGTITGTAIAFSDHTTIGPYAKRYPAAVYDSATKQMITAFRSDSPDEGQSYVFNQEYTTTNLTAQAFVGVADSAISASAAGSIIVQGGTVTGVSSGTGVSAGTAVQYSASNLADIYAADSVYDSTNNKIVVVYDGANASPGYGIVATISGTSVSYGSAVQYSGGNAQHSQVTYDSTNQRVVVAYVDSANSGYLTVAVGTVSGTSISWGTPVVADSTVNDFYIGIDFDINAGKVLIIWKDNSTAYNYSIVGTVSGTSISFGTKAAVDTTYGYQMIGGLTYDANAQKHLFFRPRVGGGTVADGYVATISGTSVSWGSATSATTTQSLSVGWGSYDSNAQKVVVTYRIGAGGMGSQVATISGTSVSFGTQVVVDASINPDFTANYYDSTDQTIVAFGRATNYYGYIGTVSGTSISWSSASTLLLDAAFGYGLGTPAYDANADKGLILFANAGDSAAESAVTTAGDLPLTVGTKYYVTTSGGFSSSADTPSVNAGLAISTTSLLLNGDS